MIHANDVPTSEPIRREPSRDGDFSLNVLDATARELLAPVWALGVKSSELRRPADLSPRERELLDFVGVHVHRIARVLTGALDFVQAESQGQLVIDRRPSDMEAICDAAVEELREAGFTGRISYEGVGDGDGEWDPGRLAQAISYLVELAATTVSPGEPIALRWRGDADEVVLRVEVGLGRLPSRVEPEWGDALALEREGALKAFLARRIALGHGGMLARFTANEATSFVMVLPRRTAEGPDHRRPAH
jgi:hypothetical protein